MDLGGCGQGGWEEIGCVNDPEQMFKMLVLCDVSESTTKICSGERTENTQKHVRFAMFSEPSKLFKNTSIKYGKTPEIK